MELSCGVAVLKIVKGRKSEENEGYKRFKIACLEKLSSVLPPKFFSCSFQPSERVPRYRNAYVPDRQGLASLSGECPAHVQVTNGDIQKTAPKLLSIDIGTRTYKSRKC